jgi:hypothetical protein
VPYNPAELRLEKIEVGTGYDAAFMFWNLRGVIAERWAHGPYFGSMGELGTQQVNLSPGPEEDDKRCTAVYGLKEAGFLAEGPKWTEAARDLAPKWLADVHEVLKPRRTVRVTSQCFAIYPVDNPEQVSRRLRGHFYRNDHLRASLPNELAKKHQDRFHAAIDWLVLEGTARTSLVAGVVGPPHQGTFFTFSDEERDQRWWMGFNLVMGDVNTGNGIERPVSRARDMLAKAREYSAHAASTVMAELLR